MPCANKERAWPRMAGSENGRLLMGRRRGAPGRDRRRPGRISGQHAKLALLGRPGGIGADVWKTAGWRIKGLVSQETIDLRLAWECPILAIITQPKQ
jgi:hypothetical protein